MTRVTIFGECMLELSSNTPNQFKQSFAGDVFSVATYMARLAPSLDVEMYTALGCDPFSDQLLDQLISEGVEGKYIARHPSKMPGLYIIRNDEKGEREFLYWRNDSAAKECFRLQAPKDLPTPDVFYLSGISLAILSNEDQETLLETLQNWHSSGTTIVFDPNHRPKLWSSVERAKAQYQRVFALSKIALPGMDDLQALYGHANAQQAIDWLKQFGCDDVIVKDGGDNIHYYSGGQQGEYQVTPVSNVVDATAAGDSFAAGFLARRLTGSTTIEAIDYASRVSAQVLQHQGAIIPKQDFSAP